MNIFIYGSKSFKKEIHSVLDHANIKFKLDEDSIVKNIDSLTELKNTIENSPHDIYLIEEEKIIKKNSLNSKVKFLTPKDGIDEDFLLEHSIPDITIDSLEDLPKYIIKKHDEYLEERENLEVQSEIIGIVDDAYSDEENIIDDELSSLLAKDESSNSEEISEKIDDFSNDGFDEYKFDENIDSEIDSKTEDSEINNKDEDEVKIVDFEKELENIDDLMDEENNDLDLSKIEDDINIDDLIDSEENEDNSDLGLEDLDTLESLIDDNETSEEDIESALQEDETNLEELDNLLEDLDLNSDDEMGSESEIKFDEEKLDEELDFDLPDLDALDNLIESSGLSDELEDEPNFEDLENKLDEISLNDTEVEENDDKIEEINLSDDKNNISQGLEEIKGEEMNDDFSQLDSITEAELLEALGDTSIPSASKPVASVNKTQSSSSETNNSVEISSNNIEDLTKLFTQLLNNKTLEITIKIKD